MKSLLKRLLFVVLAMLGLFELVCQLSVHWKESTGEVVQLILFGLLIIALAWVTYPVCRPDKKQLRHYFIQSLLVVGLLAGIHMVVYYYSWHVRPNIGLYEEPEWVAKHPEYQKKLQERIEANTW